MERLYTLFPSHVNDREMINIVLMEKESSQRSKFRVSLRAARISAGYTAKEAAQCVDVSIETLCRYERNAGELPINTANKLLQLYQFPFDLIHFGDESDTFRKKA